jgi:hypothetical protein
MTKSELIEQIAQKQSQLAYRDVELAVKTILRQLLAALPSWTSGAQSKDGRAGVSACQVRTPFQAREGAAGAG